MIGASKTAPSGSTGRMTHVQKWRRLQLVPLRVSDSSVERWIAVLRPPTGVVCKLTEWFK